MKKIIFALLLALPMTFFAQVSATKSKASAVKQTKVAPAVYAEIVLVSYEKGQKIRINFGEENKKAQKYSKAAQTEYMTFIDAMNAMSREGYRLVDSYEEDGKEVDTMHFILVKDQNMIPPRPPKPSAARPTTKK